MEQNDFYREIVRLISESAGEHNPEQMANYLYFHLKQYPDNIKVGKAWGDVLRNVKILLNHHFGWKMAEIHKFLVKLSNLTKYMKKST